MGKRDADTAELDESFDIRASNLDLHSEVLMKLKQLYETTPVQDGDVEERTLNMLRDFDIETQLKILDEFGNSNFQKIRSKDAYLRGNILKKRKVVGNYLEVPVKVQQALDRLYDDRVLKLGDLDERCMDALRSLDEGHALRAIDKLTSRNLEDIRNMSAFLMAQIKQVEKESRDMQGNQFYDHHSSHPYGGLDQSGGIYQPAFNSGINTNMPSMTIMHPHGAGLHNRHNYGIEQAQMGIRVNEFHNLSQFACYVHPAPALKLQQLWDSGVKLVALLDAQSWEALANMEGPEALVVIDETANLLESGQVRNVNAFFTSRAKNKISESRSRGASRRGYNNNGSSGSRYNNDYRGGGGGGRRGYTEDRGGYSGRDSQRREPYRDSFRGSAPRPSTRDSGGGDLTLRALPPRVQDKIFRVIENHQEFVSKDNFDSGVIQALNALSEDKALTVLTQLDERDLSAVRNVSGYIIGICRTVSRRG